MHKITTVVIIIICVTLNGHSQSKQDYVWLFGHDSRFIPGIESYMFDFKKGSSPDSIRGILPIQFFGNNASICDDNGNLLFYTNGCHVVDANHNIMPNGSGLNEGAWLEQFRDGICKEYPGTQDIMILPDPDFTNGYFILHKTIEFDQGLFMDNIKYTYVNMNLNGGFGDVTEKNIDILPEGDILLFSYLTAIAHSNNESYWITVTTQSEEFLMIQLDNSIFSIAGRFEAPVEFVENSSGAGTAKFSPDGSGFVYYNVYENLLLYDFDRSTGELTNLRQLNLRNINPTTNLFSSVEWSSNSRFLYIAIDDELWQVDTWEADLENGKVLIDRWNGVQDPFSTTFFLMALAPDCKIYMCSGSSTNTYHVINKPNEKGTACDFVQQGIRLPFVSASATMPNFPRFRVDEDDKCDPTITSIFGDHVYYRRDMTVYPNPVRDVLTVEVPEGKEGRIVVFNMQGQLVWSDSDHDSYTDKVQIDLSGLAVGTYSVEFLPNDNGDRFIYTQKVMKID